MNKQKVGVIITAVAVLLIVAEASYTQPRIVIDPDALEEELRNGELVEHVISVVNEGNEMLIFHPEVEYILGEEGWLEFSPFERALEPDDDFDMILTINAEDLNAGEYRANLHVISNDPHNGDVIVTVRLWVMGAPELAVSWDEEFGFPDIIDWNGGFEFLLTGEDYAVPLTFLNDGHDDLEVIFDECDNPFFRTEPEELVVGPGEEGIIEIILNAERDGRHEGEITFATNDPDDGEFTVPLSAVTVSSVEFVIPLNAGWNLVSAPVIPLNRDPLVIFSDLVDRGTVVIVKDGFGQFYNPEFGFSNLGLWDFRQGYQVKMSEEDELVIVGIPVDDDAPLQLQRGWNMVAYLPEERGDPPLAFRNIEDVLIMAKDGMGRFYCLEYNYCNLWPLQRGQGYMVNVSEAVELIWNVP